MKKYILFAGDCYYPEGGVDDYVGDYDTIEEAKKAYDNHKFRNSSHRVWGHIAKSEDLKEVVSTSNNVGDVPIWTQADQESDEPEKEEMQTDGSGDVPSPVYIEAHVPIIGDPGKVQIGAKHALCVSDDNVQGLSADEPGEYEVFGKSYLHNMHVAKIHFNIIS